MNYDLQRSWLSHWHAVIDDVFGPDPSFDLEAACKDPYGDFRMHFMTWDLPDESLRRCFAVLPRGAEMCSRAIEMRSLMRAKQPTISEAIALEHFQRGLDGFAQFADEEDLKDLKKPIRVVRGTSDEIDMRMPRGDRAAIVLEAIDWGARVTAEVMEAHHFLHETLYRLANHYDVADYVDWPLFADPQSVDPFRGLALLGLSLALPKRYYPMLDADGPVLYVINDSGVN